MFHALSDSAFLEKLYKEKYKDVYKLAFYTLKKYPFASLDAADITQEVFICAAQHIDVLRRHPNPTGWLYKTTCYVCKNRVRNGSSSREQLFADLSLHEEVSDTFTDTTLKLNGVSDGMVSYSRVVRLLLQYYNGADKK